MEQWTREKVLRRLYRIAQQAKKAGVRTEKDKEGNVFKEFDTRAASIELKAIEYAVKLTGMLQVAEDREICVLLEGETSQYAL
ncbi:MAG: hypothetical protein E7599_04700 [Ruminococcaceae bacterium]|nr:hypothetical protein [Oscillospiraceae bacterium]